MASAAAADSILCCLLCSVPVCLLHWHAFTDLHLQAGCMYHALLDSQLCMCLFACSSVSVLTLTSSRLLLRASIMHLFVLTSVTSFP